MNTLKTILAAAALTVAATAGAQTLKMQHQVSGVTTYEASTAVNLVVVKPEIKIDYIYAKPGEKVDLLETRVCVDVILSDHFPVISTIVLR